MSLRPPWQPGESGNPKGRPRKRLITAALEEELEKQVPNDNLKRTMAKIIAQGIIKQAMRGDIRAAREIMDRCEGRVPLPLIGADEGPIQLEIISHIARPERPMSRPTGSTPKVPSSKKRSRAALKKIQKPPGTSTIN